MTLLFLQFRSRSTSPKYVETLDQNQIPPTTPLQTTIDQPSIFIDTDRNLHLDLPQTGSTSIDLPRSDPDSENRRISRSPQRRPSYRSATSSQEADRPIHLHHRYRLHLTSDRQLLHLPRQLPQNHDNINIVAHNIGGMTKTCHYCDAKLKPS